MKKIIIETDKAPKPIGPYNQAVLAGDTLYASGQIALDPETGEFPNFDGDIVKETERVMKNLGAVLEAAGMSFSHVVKCSIFVTNMDDFATVNGVYGNYFEQNPPARETVEVKALPKGAAVEVSCIAVAD
ncbi:reactive intermediate/imine deaminase [Fulvitalea axinellae]|uniref:Reactive intermediate/imine deaminase n=1 Tax=Fulvitalea axinellae TaxID=1182444 RepID=A0AAU9CPP2_9BACT|nr:reactive intermediate/imine deaminase [Fulvitalea axinellae]